MELLGIFQLIGVSRVIKLIRASWVDGWLDGERMPGWKYGRRVHVRERRERKSEGKREKERDREREIRLPVPTGSQRRMLSASTHA
jgi:hypothetical protein